MLARVGFGNEVRGEVLPGGPQPLDKEQSIHEEGGMEETNQFAASFNMASIDIRD